MSEQLIVALVARFLLIEAPRVLDWINEMRDQGKTEVTDVDLAVLEAKWDTPAEKFFE
jgi:hypothetical protein